MFHSGIVSVEEEKFQIKLIFKTCYPKRGSGIAPSFFIAKVCWCLLSGHPHTALTGASRDSHLAMMWYRHMLLQEVDNALVDYPVTE